MLTTELIGIYIESEQLQYACLHRRIGSWRFRAHAAGQAPWNTLKGPGIALLREFLTPLKPSRQRKIWLSLPRERVFLRNFNLPAMPLEDALEAARNMLPIFCHLPPDELYYDIQLNRPNRQRVEGLLYYAARRDVDVYTAIFRETGHLNSLGGIFPFSVGMGAYLLCQGYPPPLAVLTRQEAWQELALYNQTGLCFSVSWPAREADVERPRALALAKQFWPETAFELQGLNEPDLPPLAAPPGPRLPQTPAVADNRALAALSVPLTRQQPISLDGRPVRLKYLPLWKIVTPLVVLLVVFLTLWTHQTYQAATRQEFRARQLRAQIQNIQEEVQPLEQQRAAILQSQELIQDINDFMRDRPHLYDAINEIARLVPGDTWFSNFGFREGTITMSGFSSDALRTLEQLRTSSLFEDVALQGTVSRTRAGQEQLSITMTLIPHLQQLEMRDGY